MLKTVDKIMNLMDSIEYGFKDEDGNNIINTNSKKWDEEFENFYYLQTPEELMQSQCGVCWDQVELERKLFSENGIIVKTYFIYMADKDMLPSHTFLTFETNANLYLYEYQKPKEHISCNDFYKYIETQKLIEIEL